MNELIEKLIKEGSMTDISGSIKIEVSLKDEDKILIGRFLESTERSTKFIPIIDERIKELQKLTVQYEEKIKEFIALSSKFPIQDRRIYNGRTSDIEAPWRNKDIIFKSVKGSPNLGYALYKGILIVRYDTSNSKTYCKTTWQDIERLSKLNKRDFANEKKKLDMGHNGAKRLTGLSTFVKAFQDERVKITDLEIDQTESERLAAIAEITSIDNITSNIIPLEVGIEQDYLSVSELSERVKLKDLKFIRISGNDQLQYTEYLKTIILNCCDTILTTSWNEVLHLAQFTNDIIERKVYSRFPNDNIRRSALMIFIKAYRSGVVKKSGVVNDVLKQTPINTDLERKNEDSIQNHKSEKWNNIKPKLVPGLKDLYYREIKNTILLSSGESHVFTNWDEINKLANSSIKTPNEIKRVRSDIKADDRNILLSFVDAYRSEKIRDPDAGFKRMLSLDTRTGYDGSKLEGTLEG